MTLLIGLNKRLLGLGVLLALLHNNAVWSATPSKPVFAAEVKKTFFTDRIEALGTLRANESVDISASVTEKVNALYFDDGSRVVAGDILVEMTSAEEHAQLEEARALTDEADRQYRRVKSLAAQGTAARSLLDERRRQQEKVFALSNPPARTADLRSRSSSTSIGISTAPLTISGTASRRCSTICRTRPIHRRSKRSIVTTTSSCG